MSSRWRIVIQNERGGVEDFHPRGRIAARRGDRREPQAALTADSTGAAASQFPIVFQRTTYFPDRHLDADRGAVVARLPTDGFGNEVGRGGICQPDSGVLVRSSWRDCRGPQPT